MKKLFLGALSSTILFASTYTHTYNFKSGFNKFSNPTKDIQIIDTNGTIKLGYYLGTYDNSLFGIDASKITVIWQWDGTTWLPAYPQQNKGKFTHLKSGAPVFIELTDDLNLTIENTVVDVADQKITLKSGAWNKIAVFNNNIQIIDTNGTIKLGYYLGTYDNSKFNVDQSNIEVIWQWIDNNWLPAYPQQNKGKFTKLSPGTWSYIKLVEGSGDYTIDISIENNATTGDTNATLETPPVVPDVNTSTTTTTLTTPPTVPTL